MILFSGRHDRQFGEGDRKFLRPRLRPKIVEHDFIFQVEAASHGKRKADTPLRPKIEIKEMELK
jgi:hypothetical protein